MRRAIRVFLIIRDLVLTLSIEQEEHLPLTDRTTCIAVGTSLDLSNYLRVTFWVSCYGHFFVRFFLNEFSFKTYEFLVHYVNDGKLRNFSNSTS